MKKAEIRKIALKQRMSLTEEGVQEYSRRLLGQFSKWDFSEINTIHIFLPITTKKEPDTFLFIEWLAEKQPQIKIVVPRADFDKALMINHLYQGRDHLKKNVYDIMEPQKTEIHTGDVDLVIVPLLAFDRSGYRVGYGKGFYDRFLSGLNTQKVGLSFYEPIDSISDKDEYDIPLDYCITPDRVCRF